MRIPIRKKSGRRQAGAKESVTKKEGRGRKELQNGKKTAHKEKEKKTGERPRSSLWQGLMAQNKKRRSVDNPKGNTKKGAKLIN